MTESALKKSCPLRGDIVEYAIYVYEKPEDAQQASRWRRRCTAINPDQADKRARVLFRSGLYEKVEIKQMLFDKKQQRIVDVTLKVFNERTANHPLLAWFLNLMRPRRGIKTLI
jgi:hypothetical protein